jgi:hypothetical protein
MDRTASVVRGYTRYARPEPRELARLAAVMRVRPSIFEVWAFCTGRKSATDAARAGAEVRQLADAIAARARGVPGRRLVGSNGKARTLPLAPTACVEHAVGALGRR